MTSGRRERLLTGRWRVAVAIAATVAAAVWAAYAPSTHAGLRYDDYGMVRPWTGSELVAVLHGPWDPIGIEPPFYRPLTAWWYAFRFWAFGLNAHAQHLVSLALFAVCAVLAGAFVWREVHHVFAAAAAAGIYAVYPAFVYAQVVWLTNQMHLFASLIVLIALLVWQRACRVGGGAWWGLIALQAVAFGFKEDTILLLPVLAVLTVARRWIVGPVRFPSRAVVITAIAVLVALPWWRYLSLGHRLGGYGTPDLTQGWRNLSRALDVFLQRPARRPWQGTAGWVSIGAVAAGVAAGLSKRDRPSLFLVASGAVIAAGFNLPFYLVAKAEQYHLVGLGCVLAIAGGLTALQRAPSSPRLRVAIGAGGTAAALSFLPVTRHIATDFAPCSPMTLGTDRIVLGWGIVPHEIRGWLEAKPAVCAAGQEPKPLTSLPTATWAYGRETDETGAPVHWTAGHAVVLAHRPAGWAEVTARSPIASAGTPVRVILRSDAGTAELALTDPGWRTGTVRFGRSILTSLRGMHRLDVEVSPVFVPAVRFRNDDTRVLGVLMRALDPAGDAR